MTTAAQDLEAIAGERGSAEVGEQDLPERRFDAIARVHPDRVAVVAPDGRLTYGELSLRADALARQLRASGVRRETIVAISLPRRLNMVVALLAVLKAGGAYLALDPAYPPARRSLMLSDSGAAVLLTGPDGGPPPGVEGVNTIVLGEDAAADSASPALAPARLTTLAYVMYTSGSTGRPKGVMIERHSLATFTRWATGEFAPAELAAVLASTSLSFDISVFELLVPLSAGGRVVLADNLLSLPHGEDVTLVNTVPSLMAAFLQARGLPASVRTVVLAGEQLSRELVERLHREPGVERVVNAYGPTEDTIYSTHADVAAGSRPPIGRPLPGTRAYLVASNGGPAAPGQPGELYLAGAGLARGYLGRDELTRERFVDVGGERMYRTGDLVRCDASGVLHHHGRIDSQLKLRGVRIEPAEIESELLRHPAVRSAVVVARERKPAGERQLVAYLAFDEGETPSSAELRSFLRRALPDPLIPALFVVVDEMPLTPNGKLDRGALPDPDAPRSSTSGWTRTESRLSAIWRDLLDLDEAPRPGDDFFALGGHSLLAIELVTRIAERFSCELAPTALLEATTLRQLAAAIDAGVAEQKLIIPINPNGRLAPLFYFNAGAGGMLTLRSFGPSLGPGRPLYAIQAYGDLDELDGEPPSVEATAARYLERLRELQPDGPLLLAGHSIGGQVAFELACRLEALGRRVAFLALVDPAAPHTLRWAGRVRARSAELLGMGPEDRRERVLRVGATAAARRVRRKAPEPAQAAAAAADRSWEATLSAVERRYRPGRFGGRAVVYSSADTARFAGCRDLGWGRYAAAIETVRIPGSHVSMLLQPNVQTLASEIACRIDRIDGDVA